MSKKSYTSPGFALPEALLPEIYLTNGKPKSNPFVTTATAGETIRIRLVNGNYEDAIYFTIEGHNFTVISLDTRYVEPLVVEKGNYIAIGNGTVPFSQNT